MMSNYFLAFTVLNLIKVFAARDINSMIKLTKIVPGLPIPATFLDAEYSGQWPRTLDVPEMSSFSLQCKFAGAPQPIISWTKDGHPIDQSDDLRADENDYQEDQWFQPSINSDISIKVSKLKIRCADTSSSGRYQCTAVTRLGNATSPMSTNVRVHENGQVKTCVSTSLGALLYGRDCIIPEILSWTDAVTTTPSHSSFIRLTCRASGSPRPKITWLMEKTLVKNGDDFEVLNNGDLIIKNPGVLTKVTSFTCKANSFCGEDSIESSVIPVVRPNSDNEDPDPVARFLNLRSS